MTDLSPRLARLGDELQRAASAELDRGTRRRLTPRVALVAAVTAVVLGSGIAVAAEHLIDTTSVANSLPAGAAAPIRTHPTCPAGGKRGQEPRTLRGAPADQGFPWGGAPQP